MIDLDCFHGYNEQYGHLGGDACLQQVVAAMARCLRRPSDFLGRLAVSELMDLSDHIRELILDKRPASEIRRAAKEEGMTFLRESALEQVLRGVTTLREINKVTFVE